MVQTLFAIAVTIFFFFEGVQLIRNPERFLIKFGRPTTTEHVRATRIIGGFFLLFVVVVIAHWARR